MATQPDLDLNSGLDFERARERLTQQAGAAFRRLNAILTDEAQPAEAIFAARQEAQAAQANVLALRPDDAPAIQAVLQQP